MYGSRVLDCKTWTRSLNFSGGPGALPESVLDEAQRAIGEAPGTGQSVLGISHRSEWFRDVVAETEDNFRVLLDLPDRYRVLFLQGGGTLQFSMVPMTLLRGRKRTAEYLHTGYWSGKAVAEARKEGAVRVAWSGAAEGFTRLPDAGETRFSGNAAYLHYVSNETVEGLQFDEPQGREDVPRVCDMSSDFLSRPVDIERFALVYAHAQKNLGPAGVTVVVLRDDVLESVPEGLPAMLDYREHARAGSIYNTPPLFAIYVTMLVTRWLRDEIGGLDAMAALNSRKAELLYETIDASGGFYRGHAAPGNRSQMNVVLTLPSEELERKFLRMAGAAGFYGLAGHRTLGGIRASIYNAVTVPAVEALCSFMRFFRDCHAGEAL
jgi:phosphoserine aminotransferase